VLARIGGGCWLHIQKLALKNAISRLKQAENYA
jgi:hypothetical protein